MADQTDTKHAIADSIQAHIAERDHIHSAPVIIRGIWIAEVQHPHDDATSLELGEIHDCASWQALGLLDAAQVIHRDNIANSTEENDDE